MKKLSGHYLDNQDFTHTVFYDFSKKKYIKITCNEIGAFCSSAEYTKKQIAIQIKGMVRLKD